jgi:4-amino-4-deoxy-L-arabinose transferase-like glycosyltransferase
MKKILLLLIGLCALLLILSYLTPLTLWDENAYLANARSHIKQANFNEDFRFPLLEYIIAVFWLVTGEYLLIARLIMISFTLAGVFFFYLISKFYLPEKKAFYGTVLFAVCPLIIYWGFRIYTDIPAMVFMAIAYYLILKDNLEFLAGILFAVSFLIKFPFALFGLAVVVYFLFKKKYKKMILFAAGFGIALIPWMIFNYMHYKNPFWDFFIQQSIVKTYAPVEPASKHLVNLVKAAGILVLFIPSGIAVLIKEKKQYGIMFMHILLFIIYYFFILQLKDIRYYAVILPFIYIIIITGVGSILKDFKPVAQKIILGLIIVSSLLLFTQTVFTINKDAKCDKAIIQAISYMQSHKDAYPVIISNIWPYFGYYNNVHAYALWQNNIDTLITRHKADYIIYYENAGLEFNKSILDRELSVEKTIAGSCSDKLYIYKILN